MMLCEGCAGEFDSSVMEVTARGVRCPECAKSVAARRTPIGAATALAATALALTFCLQLGWSSSTSLNGVTETHAVHLQQLIGGPLAVVLGVTAVGVGLSQRRIVDLSLSALVVLVGVLQLARGLLAL